jgi:hypothetical protein
MSDLERRMAKKREENAESKNIRETYLQESRENAEAFVNLMDEHNVGKVTLYREVIASRKPTGKYQTNARGERHKLYKVEYAYEEMGSGWPVVELSGDSHVQLFILDNGDTYKFSGSNLSTERDPGRLYATTSNSKPEDTSCYFNAQLLAERAIEYIERGSVVGDK